MVEYTMVVDAAESAREGWGSGFIYICEIASKIQSNIQPRSLTHCGMRSALSPGKNLLELYKILKIVLECYCMTHECMVW